MSSDRSRSRAILIGTSHHRDPAIRPLPANTCVSEPTDLLTSDVCGWPRERVTAIEDAETPRDAVMELVKRSSRSTWRPPSGGATDFVAVLS
ncbi:hypothetical protein ABT104_29385 [Streptomyces mobaraensis]|uniref:hypothetical protein n=1 Tax=Streptomyces mobaraensis TaxID=35621 RepID=UPI003329304E